MKRALTTYCLMLLCIVLYAQPYVAANGSDKKNSSTYKEATEVRTMSAYTIHSGQHASTIYEPFEDDTNGSQHGNRASRQWGDDISDPGERDKASPIGDGWIMLLMGLIFLLVKTTSLKHNTSH